MADSESWLLMTVVSVPGCPRSRLGTIIVSKIAGLLIDRTWSFLVACQLQFPLLVQDRPASRTFHIGEEVDSIRLDCVGDGVVAGSRSLFL